MVVCDILSCQDEANCGDGPCESCLVDDSELRNANVLPRDFRSPGLRSEGTTLISRVDQVTSVLIGLGIQRSSSKAKVV